MGVDLGYLIMPVIAGWVVTAQHDAGATMPDAYSTMYRVLIIPVILGLVIYVIFGRGNPRAKVSPEPME